MSIPTPVLATLVGLGGSGLLGLGSYGLNQASSAINSKRAWKYSRKAMEYQDQLNRSYTRDSYGLMRTGLEQAGYNPLLALGSSANSAVYSPTMMNSDSDQGTQAFENAINTSSAVSSIKNTNANTENVNKNTKLVQEQIEGQQIENKIKQLQYDTDPKNIAMSILSGKENKTVSALSEGYSKVQKFAKKAGIDLPELPPLPQIDDNLSNSAVKSNKIRNNQKRIIKLYDTRFGKPQVYSKGVPRNVVNSFKKLERM